MMYLVDEFMHSGERRVFVTDSEVLVRYCINQKDTNYYRELHVDSYDEALKQLSQEMSREPMPTEFKSKEKLKWCTMLNLEGSSPTVHSPSTGLSTTSTYRLAKTKTSIQMIMVHDFTEENLEVAKRQSAEILEEVKLYLGLGIDDWEELKTILTTYLDDKLGVN